VASLDGFIDELIATVRAVSGIHYAPDDPPSKLATHPAAVVWLTGGRSVIGPPELATWHHGVRVGLLTSMDNIAMANQRILPQIEPVVEAIWTKMRSMTEPFTNCQNIEQITYAYGPVQWADVWYFGALIDLEEVKIQRAL
jgi:hypothetical protein